jgi:hypothetical protein
LTAADLIERVLPPESGLRQWVLTFPFSWRERRPQSCYRIRLAIGDCSFVHAHVLGHVFVYRRWRSDPSAVHGGIGGRLHGNAPGGVESRQQQ